MPVIRTEDAVVHEMHGTRFVSYASPSLGSAQLCAWRVEIPAGADGVPHRVSHEEVLCVLSGTVQVTVDGETSAAGPGDVVLFPPGSSVRVGNPGDTLASAWVTTSAGLQATLADGSSLVPPWTR